MKEKSKEKEPYIEPKVLATYKKEELEEIIKTQGTFVQSPVQVNSAG